MPSQHSQSHSQRPALGATRSTDSNRSNTDSPSSTPPQHHKSKGASKHAHVVGGSRLHSRVPSTKGLHKSHSKVHANDYTLSHPDLRKLGKHAASSTNLKNVSHSNLKRNRSSADVPITRSRSDSGHTGNKKATGVHFEIGDSNTEDADADADGWEEASSTASPTLSRSGQSSARPGASANNSRSHSAPQSPTARTQVSPSKTRDTNADTTATNGDRDSDRERQTARHVADAKAITERLLQRTPSLNTTKMSLATATPTSTRPNTATASSEASQVAAHNGVTSGPTYNGSAGSSEALVSRFVTGSGTPGDSSYLSSSKSRHAPTPSSASNDPKPDEAPKRAKSMGHLNRLNTGAHSSDEEDNASALTPRSRKPSHGGGPISGYIPPQQSRTQQKLWLQRASSNIEPQQLPPGQPGLGLGGLGLGLHGGLSATGLVGALGGGSYDGRDLRVKLQLERTGMEYLVVRRYQDPVAKALRRLRVLEVFDGNKKAPSGAAPVKGGSIGRAAARRSMGPIPSSKSATGVPVGSEGGSTTPVRLSYDGGSRSTAAGTSGSHENGSAIAIGSGARPTPQDDETNAMLRRIWEKSYELSGSTD